MKKLILIISFIALGAGMSANAQLKIGGKTINTKKALDAAGDVATAVTLTDADVAMICKEAIDWMDAHNPVLPATEKQYGARLARLTKGITEVNGIPLNFKVYHVVDINAFACGDGSIRVFSSLMDIMNDDELMAIIGHEIGHIANSDVKDAIKNAYLVSAGRNAASAAGGTVGKLSDSDLGALSEAFLGSSFSKKQEYEADEYGFMFTTQRGYSPYAMSEALQRLVELSSGAKSSLVTKMFSSHPDSEKRSAKMKERADAFVKNNK